MFVSEQGQTEKGQANHRDCAYGNINITNTRGKELTISVMIKSFLNFSMNKYKKIIKNFSLVVCNVAKNINNNFMQ